MDYIGDMQQVILRGQELQGSQGNSTLMMQNQRKKNSDDEMEAGFT